MAARELQDFRQGKENAFRRFLHILFERKRIMISIFVPVFLCSSVMSVLLPSAFRASAKFALVLPYALDPLQQERTYDCKHMTRLLTEEQKELVLSARVLWKVVERTFPDMASEDIPKQIDKIREKVEVTPPPGESFGETSVFYVSYKANDPQRAAEITKTIANTYLQVYDELHLARSDDFYDFFKEQAATIHADMTDKERILRDYEKEKTAAPVEISSAVEETSIYEHKQQQYQLAKNAYASVRSQMEQARLGRVLNSSKQRLIFVEEPSVPHSPYKPDRLMIFTLGLISAVFLGIAAAGAVEYLDHTIRSPQDIEGFLKVPMLGSIPKVGQKEW